MNHSEQRAGDVEFGCTEMPDADSKMMDKVVTPEMLPEGRCSKRVADDANLRHTPYSMTKKIKLDEHLVNNVASIQEHWKKGALGHRSREMSVDASDCGNREVAEGSKELSVRVDCLDSTIHHNEVALSKLRNSLGHPNESVDKDNGELEVEVGGNTEELKPNLNCLEQVLIENQRKAEASHALLDKTKSVIGSFLYRQPCDTAVYHENKQKFMTFKKKLVAYLKNRDEAQQLRSENLSKQWNRLYHAWKKKMETVEGHQNQKFCSSGLKASEQNCSVDALNVEAEVMKKLSLIVLPPPVLDSRISQLGLLSENGNVEDSIRLNSTSTVKCNIWTDREHEMLIKKYTQNPKKLGLLASLLEDKNNMKEETGENGAFTVKPSGRKLLPLDNESGISSARVDAFEMELGDDTAHMSGMENSDEPGVNRRSLSLLEHTVSRLPSNSSESSVTRTSRASGKFREAGAFPKTSGQLGNIPDHPHPMEEGGRVDDMHESDTAAADEDNESTATLSAEEADGHCPDDDDDNLAAKTPPFKPLQAAGKKENILGMKMQEYGPEHFRTEVNCSEAPHSQWFLPMPVISEEQSRHLSAERDERKNYNTTSAVRPSSAPKRKNESLRSVRSSAKDVDGRAEAMPKLLPLNPPAPEGHSRVSYSPSPVNHFSGGQVTVRAPAVPSVFSRNSRSPTRIRDLIHAAIEKNLQAIDNKTDLAASSRNDTWQIRQTGNLNYKPPSSSLLDVENTEVQDLSIRTSRCASSSSSKVSSTTAGKTQVQQTALYHHPKVDSSCHPRPAHAHHSDPRAGSLLDLADAAEYERLRQLERERQQAIADRDASFKQFETSAAEESFGLNLPAQAWRQREESGHKGSVAQLTPVAIAHHYRIQNSQQTADAYIEGLEIHPTAVGHGMEIQCEPPSWHRPAYPQVVPQSSTELLHNDFLIAQQLRTFRGSSLHLQTSRPYQDVPPRAALAARYDTRTARLCRPPGAAQTAPRFSGTDVTSCHRQQLSLGQVQAELTVTSSGGQKLYGGWHAGSHRVPPGFKNSSLETGCERLPSTVQADKSPKPSVTSAPFRPYKPDQLGLHRISAAQLIEEIINTQINRPEGGNKVPSSSILSQIDYEISPASYDDSVFAHVPSALKSNRNGSEHTIPRTGSKSTIPEKTAELNEKRTGRSSIPSTEAHDQLFNSDMNIHRREMELPAPKRSCISHTMASNKLLTLSSGTIQDTGTFPFYVTNMNSEDTSLYSGQVKKPTVDESIDVIIKDDTRHGSCQNPIDDTCSTTRNYIAGSDLTQRVNSQKREDFGKESGINCSSSSQHACLDKANSFGSDELKLKENQEGVSKDNFSSSRQFNWKMRLLKEHQKQLVEHEDQGQTIQNSSGIGRKMSDSQSCQTPSSEILLPLNNQEGSSVVQSDTSSYPTSRLSSPNGVQCSLGSSVACVVGEDHHSAIAATHQMMSTLLSTRSGCQLGPPPLSSALPVQPDPPPPLKPATASDSALKKAVTSEQEEAQTNSPVAAEPESPGSDSQGSDQSGRLVIRMDSMEDWKSS